LRHSFQVTAEAKKLAVTMFLRHKGSYEFGNIKCELTGKKEK